MINVPILGENLSKGIKAFMLETGSYAELTIDWKVFLTSECPSSHSDG